MVGSPPPPATGKAGEGSWLHRVWDSDIGWSFRHSPVAIVSAIVSIVMILAAILAPLFAPQDPFNPATLNLMEGLTPPGQPNEFTQKSFVFGSDSQGRDMFSAVLYGTQVSLLVGAASVLFSAVFGVLLGLIAGYVGGKTESIIMRIADIQLSFPAILIALLIFGVARGVIPPGQQEDATLILLILAIGLSNWAQYARTVRGSTMVEKNKEYVQAARVIGRSPFLIMVKHILPNVMGPVTVIATINLALAIIEEATLSFLGVGMPPTQPSLGTLIRVGQQFLFSGEWWILFFPAITLIILALAINLLGDWLR
ncbi:MAG: ABC transporter permease, partial [Rhabdaerophilum sp.]